MTGFLIGLLIFALSCTFLVMITNQYYFKYPDLDKFLAYTVLSLLGLINGVSVMAVAFLYQRLIELTHRLDGVEDYLGE